MNISMQIISKNEKNNLSMFLSPKAKTLLWQKQILFSTNYYFHFLLVLLTRSNGLFYSEIRVAAFFLESPGLL